ncbi:MAG: nucleotidyltransferase family protein [Candidatus Omnitrophota bacterium]|nr:nucleotidyltransferase family protein [Candidatus Omnitrophota bacterium]
MKSLNPYPALDRSPAAAEDELLLLLSRQELSCDERSRANFLVSSGRIDWEYFVDAVNFQDVISLVYRQLQILTGHVPEFVMDFVRDGSAGDLSRNVYILEKVKELSSVFHEDGLKVLFLKGVPLIMDVYRDRGLRAFADIDILVVPEELKKVNRVFSEKGFRLCDGETTGESYRSQISYSFEDRIFLDVHKGFLGRILHNRMLGLTPGIAWEGRREVSLDGIKVFTPGLVHDLLYQCLHISIQHSFAGLKWFVDIHEFINRHKGRIDWDEFLRLTREYRIRRPVYYSLLFTKDLLGTDIPGHVIEELARIERRLDRWAFRRIKANPGDVDYFAELVMFDSIWDTVRFILLSFVSYPRHLGHFLGISGKIVKQIFIEPIS